MRDSVVTVKRELQSKTSNFSSSSGQEDGDGPAGYPGALQKKISKPVWNFENTSKRRRKRNPACMKWYTFWMVGGRSVCAMPNHESPKICRRGCHPIIEKQHWNLEGRQGAQFLESKEAMGCPLEVLHTQLPILQSGIAKNGSIVAYFEVGGVSLESLDCLTDLENFKAYVFNVFTHSFRRMASKEQAKFPKETILSEITFVVDLKGIQRSLFTERVMKVLKSVVGVLNCFPEILSKLVITNAPFFFSAIWLILKGGHL